MRQSTVERRQQRIARRLEAGQTPGQIARAEGVTIRTVYNVRQRLLARQDELATSRR